MSVELGCICQHCRRLQSFLSDPEKQTARLEALTSKPADELWHMEGWALLAGLHYREWNACLMYQVLLTGSELSRVC